MRTVSAASVAASDEGIEGLPEAVLEALGELAGAAREGLLALSVGVGLGVLHELLEAEVDEVVGPKGRHNADRTAVRHGHEAGRSRSEGGSTDCSPRKASTSGCSRYSPAKPRSSTST